MHAPLHFCGIQYVKMSQPWILQGTRRLDSRDGIGNSPTPRAKFSFVVCFLFILQEKKKHDLSALTQI